MITTADVLESALEFIGTEAKLLPWLIVRSAKQLQNVLITIAAFSVVWLVLAVLISAIPVIGLALVFWMAFPYLAIILLILRGRQALHAAGLLVVVDVVHDQFAGGKGILVKNLGDAKIAFDMDFPKARNLETLLKVGKFIFEILILELVAIAVIGFVPIWQHPLLIGPLLVVGIIWALMRSPWGQASSFKDIGPVAGLVLGILVTILVFNQILNVADTFRRTTITPFMGIVESTDPLLLLTVCAVAAFIISMIPDKKSTGEKK